MAVILLASDFSEASESALNWAYAHANRINGTIVVAHVLPRAPHQTLPNELDSRWEEQIKKQALMRTKRFGGLYPNRIAEQVRLTCQVDEEILVGSVARQLLLLGQERRADMIVLGIKSKSQTWPELPFGSIAKTVIESELCSVVCVPEHYTTRRIRQIALASKSDEVDEVVMERISRFAARWSAQIVRFRIFTDGASHVFKRQGTEGANEERFSKEFEIRSASVEEGIIDFIRKHECDLLVLGSHKHRSFPWPTPNIAKYVYDHTDIPVLFVPEKTWPGVH